MFGYQCNLHSSALPYFMNSFLQKNIWILTISFIQDHSHLALRTNIIQLHSFSSVVMMQNSRTPLWYICQQKANIHVKWTDKQYKVLLNLGQQYLIYFARYRLSWSGRKHFCLLTLLSFHQSPYFRLDNKDCKRPIVSAQCTEWHCS